MPAHRLAADATPHPSGTADIIDFFTGQRVERASLHFRCLVRRPSNWQFHMKGIRREIAGI